jgi:hypothetical protein
MNVSRVYQDGVTLTTIRQAFILPPGRTYAVLVGSGCSGCYYSFGTTPISLDGISTITGLAGGVTLYLWANSDGDYNIQIVSD